MGDLLLTVLLTGFGNFLVVAGLFMLVGGWMWTVMTAFKSGVGWGIANIIPIQPLIGIISALFKKVEWQPVIIMFIGGMVMGIGRSS